MSENYHTLEWQETMNGVTIQCSLDIAIHPSNIQTVLLTIPGVDGSVDGYENKYQRIAESVQAAHGAAVVRMSNPFITSLHWESNVRQALGFILENSRSITGSPTPEIRIMAHSAGAAIIARIAWEYPEISRLLLINPAAKLGTDKIKKGIVAFAGDTTILIGSKDPSITDIVGYAISAAIVVVDGVDHYFSGDAMEQFIQAPHVHLFSDNR